MWTLILIVLWSIGGKRLWPQMCYSRSFPNYNLCPYSRLNLSICRDRNKGNDLQKDARNTRSETMSSPKERKPWTDELCLFIAHVKSWVGIYLFIHWNILCKHGFNLLCGCVVGWTGCHCGVTWSVVAIAIRAGAWWCVFTLSFSLSLPSCTYTASK